MIFNPLLKLLQVLPFTLGFVKPDVNFLPIKTKAMILNESVKSACMFSRQAVDKQVKKMMADPVFATSKVLKNFLLFVVDETLKGNANNLKEYTIAVNVLAKPADFKPQQSGIVRIHANRLRRALNNYYSGSGCGDSIRISIPKGRYIPVFDANEKLNLASEITKGYETKSIGVGTLRNSQNSTKNPFAEDLIRQLSTALIKSDQFSIVAHYALRNQSKNDDIVPDLACSAGLQFLLMGDLELIRESIRVHLQLITLGTRQLLWSQTYKRIYAPEKLFDVQDDIIQQAISDLSRNSFLM